MTQIHQPTTIPTDFATEDFWQIPPPLPDVNKRLHRLAEALYADLEIVKYPGRTWNYSRDPDILEVAILGAGQAGKSAAFGLRQQGISRVRVFDKRTPGQEGVWRTFARNATLRSPKKITGGLDWGVANLNFRRWCAAVYGDDYWQKIKYIPRLIWAEYLDWYGKVLDLPIQNETNIQNITWNRAEQCFLLHAQHQGMDVTYKARFVILATGMECAGGKKIPAIVKNNLPEGSYHHTMDAIDFSAFAHKRVMIIGGGASAFDNALLLLKAGAQSVDIAIRRDRLPNLNRIRWSEWNGYHRHYIDLPDADKWGYSLSEFRIGQLPPAHTYYQTVSHNNFTLYTSAPIQQLSYHNGKIVGEYGDHTFHHDALICGTGFESDIARQRELTTLAPHIARWQDAFTPPAGEEHSEMSRYPYLGKSLEFMPKSAEHSYLSRCYYPSCGGAFISGFRANLTDLAFALPRIIYDIGRQLFIEQQADIKADFEAYDAVEY
ncbi:MAG: NAD(P)/FAD-dependent oxidoreductase [Cyanobacteria bacterium J06598_3]